ncbi:hypothetical protein ACLB2K_007489 [Fragaria x ananassa]
MFQSTVSAKELTGMPEPGNDIDVYLQPLVDDLKVLWDGVERVNRRQLSRHHPYRKQASAFDNTVEKDDAPTPLTGEETFARVKGLPKASVRHNLDVMNIEKNCCDAILGTLLNIPRKTKDEIAARLDMVDMEIRTDLKPTIGVANEIRIADNEVPETIRWLAGGPNKEVPTFYGYHVNGVDFNTMERDNKRSVQNSGVFLVADAMQVANAKDKWPTTVDMDFYGQIQQIWEVDYYKFRVGHLNDPFVLATHVKQIFYIEDPLDVEWSMAVRCPDKDFKGGGGDDDDYYDYVLQGIPEQKDGNTCAYLVMHYMKDIIADQDLEFATTWKTKQSLCYTPEKIDEVRAEWAKQVLMFKV